MFSMGFQCNITILELYQSLMVTLLFVILRRPRSFMFTLFSTYSLTYYLRCVNHPITCYTYCRCVDPYLNHLVGGSVSLPNEHRLGSGVALPLHSGKFGKVGNRLILPARKATNVSEKNFARAVVVLLPIHTRKPFLTRR